MKIRKQMLATAVATGMVGLAACGGGGDKGTQDAGTNVQGNNGGSSTRTFHARAIDGYLAGAAVYVDQNGNGSLDAFEPRAITDNEGYFSYNHRTQTDYCATGGLTEHCLRGAIAANAEVIIRVTGGYDTVTQLPFKGVLSLRSSELDRDDLRLVTPLTSAVADSSDAQSKLNALIQAGLVQPGGSLNDDPLSRANFEQMSRQQLLAIISRTVGEVGKLSHGAAVFDDVESQSWAHGYIAAAAKLVEGIGAGSASFASTFSTPASLEEVARRAIFAVMNPSQPMPVNYQLPNPSGYANLLQVNAELIALNEELLDGLQGSSTQEQLHAILRFQAVAAARAFANPFDPELSDVAAWARAQLAQGNGLGTDLTRLGEDNIDLSALIAPSFNFDPNSNSISASAKIPAEAATAFASLVNTAFAVNVDKVNEQGDALLFVSGTAGARAGDIKVCVRYRGDDGDFDTTNSTDPNGALLVGGRWSLLDDHTLTLNINVAGGVRPLLLKAVGTNVSGLKYRFDFGDDLSDWSGSAPAGFASGAVPSTDAACKASLIERFGTMS